MSPNQEKFINNIKNRLQQRTLPGLRLDHPGSFQGYSFDPNASLETLTHSFKLELETLSGQVYQPRDIEEVVPIILEILQDHSADQIISWTAALPQAPWLHAALSEAGVDLKPVQLSHDAAERKVQLAAIEAVKVGLTGAQGGLADSGAVALVSGARQSRLASLLPPVHIALLATDRLYPSLPAFLAANPTVTGDGSNLVLIAGPSRSGDIELTLSMGVHGPGEVHVILIPPGNLD